RIRTRTSTTARPGSTLRQSRAQPGTHAGSPSNTASRRRPAFTSTPRTGARSPIGARPHLAYQITSTEEAELATAPRGRLRPGRLLAGRSTARAEDGRAVGAEVGVDHDRVGQDTPRRPLRDDRARLEGDELVGDLRDQRHVVLDDDERARELT